MSFSFATCERHRALGFLKKLFPSYVVEDAGATKTVLDLVEKDLIRVLDPDFHAGGVQASKCTDAEWSGYQPALQNMVDEIRNKRSGL